MSDRAFDEFAAAAGIPVAVRVEHRFCAIDDLRGAEQHARVHFWPVDLIELRTRCVKHRIEVVVLFSRSKCP